MPDPFSLSVIVPVWMEAAGVTDTLRALQKEPETLDAFFKELSGSIKLDLKDRSFVLLGHGKGKADVAEQFSKWLAEHDKSVYDRILGVAAIDLSAATDADIEQRAIEVTRGGVV